MKLSRTIALTALAAIIGAGSAFAADNSKPAQAAPEKPAATESKSAATEQPSTPAPAKKHHKKHHTKSKAKQEQPTG